MEQQSIRAYASPQTLRPSTLISQDEKFESAVCRDCGAVYSDGHWQWRNNPSIDLVSVRCDACERVREKQPAGYVTLQGKFSREHCDDLISFIRNVETQEKSENPLRRIMAIDRRAEKILIATTDAQLVRSMGKALQREYEGKLDLHYHKNECVLRALWQR